ncbi:glycosyltransferase family protein [Candidatus Parcubacteria bacterium]|nr:glycosyltransferase family protein [Candidatus Parcubacteria bacterium]
MVTAIIQARTTSSRLPNKVLMDLAGKSMVLRVIERAKKCSTLKEVILVIPEGKENDVLEQVAQENKVKYFRGSENNVLSRYYEAAKKFGVETIVRITADCPFLEPRVVDALVRTHKKSKVDLTANNLKITFPVGLGLQVFSFNALEKAFQFATTDFEKEHVIPYMREHPELFSAQNIEAKGKLRRPDLNLTVDTLEDYKIALTIFQKFKNKFFHIEDVINFYESKHYHPNL